MGIIDTYQKQHSEDHIIEEKQRNAIVAESYQKFESWLDGCAKKLTQRIVNDGIFEGRLVLDYAYGEYDDSETVSIEPYFYVFEDYGRFGNSAFPHGNFVLKSPFQRKRIEPFFLLPIGNWKVLRWRGNTMLMRCASAFCSR